MSRYAYLLVLALWPAAALAQVEPYNPYAPSMDERLPPVAANGKLNWPTFFKSARTEAKYRALFLSGSCVGTKQTTNAMLRENKVDVNELPETTVSGIVQKVQPGIVLLRDSAGQTCALVLHPANVTKVHVAGTLPATSLRPGLVVRLLARIDATGRGTEPLESLEIIGDEANLSAPPVETNHLQTIVGVVTRAKPNYLQLQVSAGKLHRLSFVLAEAATVSVDADSLKTIAVGAAVQAKGHVYSGFGSLNAKTYFISEMEVQETAAQPLSPASTLASRAGATGE